MMNTHKSQDSPTREVLRRRYWIQIPEKIYVDNKNLTFPERWARHEAQKDLIKAGFRTDRYSHNLVIKTCDCGKMLHFVELAKVILNGNGGDLKGIKVTTQPLCKNCGALLKFSSKTCQDCGSKNIEPAGLYDIARGRIVFKKEGA